MNNKERLEKFREIMADRDIDAYIITAGDPHQSEYVADRWKTYQWLTGFSGEAGTVAITADEAGLWTDSRFFLQAEDELEGSGVKLFKMKTEGVPKMNEWLKEQLDADDTLGFNGECMSVKQVEGLRKELGDEIDFKTDEDLIDLIWEDRPPIPKEIVKNFGKEFCGESRKSKIKRIREKMADIDCKGYLMAALDSIAWLYNFRGSDIEFNPVAISYAYITEKEAYLFIKKDKLDGELKTKLESDDIIVQDYDAFFDFLKNIDEKSIVFDPAKISIKLKNQIPDSCDIIEKMDLVTVMKAVKNEKELEGMRKAHLKDGVAMVKWLKWVEENVGKQKYTEWDLAEKLESFRQEQENYINQSFHPIIGYKANGAIVHYSPTAKKSAEVKKEGILLSDSGGQYLEGTTDITRTISLDGNPPDLEKEIFTMVLRGNIGLSKALFPRGYTGKMVDTFAGGPLWEKGYNYQHGTGHGIGHYLNVHESTSYYQFRPESDGPIKPGMVTSVEPACYLEGKFGIRTENVVITVEKISNDFGTFYGHETITLCPIDINLIDKSMMTKSEIKWFNDYHREVYEKLAPHLNDEERTWLKKKTRPL